MASNFEANSVVFFYCWQALSCAFVAARASFPRYRHSTSGLNTVEKEARVELKSMEIYFGNFLTDWFENIL